MTREEFADRITAKAPTREQYGIIETVYAHHPAIDEVQGKDQIATIYNMFGMRVILDMLPTAMKAKEIEEEKYALRAKLARLTADYEALVTGANEIAIIANNGGQA